MNDLKLIAAKVVTTGIVVNLAVEVFKMLWNYPTAIEDFNKLAEGVGQKLANKIAPIPNKENNHA